MNLIGDYIMTAENVLLIIDPQNDFCDKTGKLYVPNSENDIDNICQLIDTKHNMFNRVIVSLDTHSINHIAAPTTWIDNNGNHPTPFTILDQHGIDQNTNTQYKSANNDDKLIEALERHYKVNKNPMIIWPNHCVVGTFGAAVVEKLNNTIYKYTNKYIINHILKGQDIYSEQYGCFNGPTTVIGCESNIINLTPKNFYVCGEAKSHCVLETIEQLLQCNIFRAGWKVFVINDCTSPVTGFENLFDQRMEQYISKGLVTVVNSFKDL